MGVDQSRDGDQQGLTAPGANVSGDRAIVIEDDRHTPMEVPF